MVNGFKTDEDYGYCIELSNSRKPLSGHKLGFDKNDTEVSAIAKILQAYFNTESIEKLIKFSEYKLEFALSVIDSFYLSAKDILIKGNDQYDELEKQLTDLAHKMTKNKIGGYEFSVDEKIEIFDIYQELLNKRRLLKDTLAVLRVLVDNMEKTRNFILGMNRRNFTPKSQRFKDDEDFVLKSKDNHEQQQTVVYIQPTIPQITSKIVKH